MHVIKIRNVCEALPLGLAYLMDEGRREDSRAGPVLVAPGPVTTVYERPTERVLFSTVRDANPFFHLYESVWMLAGRDDAASLNQFVGRFGASYGEPGGEVHGAYGRRWRSALGFDQLDYVVQTLRCDPSSRQCVIQMWDASPRHEVTQDSCGVGMAETNHLYAGQDDLRGDWRDRPCNTHCYLRVRGDRGMRSLGHGDVEDYDDRVLDLTVLCRSNDAIWGAHGANAVHFSVLQEYLAARIGVGVGVMCQVSNNYHAYVLETDRLCGRVVRPDLQTLPEALRDNRYSFNEVSASPMFESPDRIDDDVGKFTALYDETSRSELVRRPLDAPIYDNPWFADTLTWAMLAHGWYKQKNLECAAQCASRIESTDWRTACAEWIRRRSRC